LLVVSGCGGDEEAVAPAGPLKIPVLMYHEVTTDSTKWDYATISPEKLRSDLTALRDNGFTPIFFKDIDQARKGKANLPVKPVLVTFDDGYYNNYEFAYPILQEMKMKATISVIGWSVGRQYHLDNVTLITRHFTWEEGKEMYDSGLVDIQSHSFNLHNQSDTENGVAPFPGESAADYTKRFKADTQKLKDLIESKIGNKVIVYTYPYGVYNETSEALIKELGFEYSLTVDDGVSDFNVSPYLLKRINAPIEMPSADLIKAIELGIQ
jgi:peptidoglycan/xylan/chitin deacetylase (PgdA/CDA1 family)